MSASGKSKLVICEEMQKLRDWLKENDIDWYDDSEDGDYFWMARTKFHVNDHFFSVINGMGSYGGYILGFENQELLECMIDNSEPEGWLTAEDVKDKIKSIWKKEKKEKTNATATS